MTDDWIDDFLPTMQCPHTREALRHASDLEKERAGIGKDQTALANQSGTHVYPVIDRILRLLPDDAVVITPS
ncbi:MAG: hypothetical protein JNJ83_19635 [Verrucomicrobiaceae bacterium]|nr:hypothetical protein [Verrucomicrobiaceae bacterium]